MKGVRDWELFEFMDIVFMPKSIRLTLRDALECALGSGKKSYYRCVAELANQRVLAEKLSAIMELGAGTAPISRTLSQLPSISDSSTLIVSDLHPDIKAYEDLLRKSPRVRAELKSVDFSQPLDVSFDVLLVISAAFHHIPKARRRRVLENLKNYPVIISEALGTSLVSLATTLLVFIPVICTPLWFLRKKHRRPGHWRRFLWCWFVPLAIPLLTWDSVVSWNRCWTQKEWLENLSAVFANHKAYRYRFHLTRIEVQW